MKPSPVSLYRASRILFHENPLGLPKAGSIPRMQRGLPERRRIKNVDKVIAVSSAKGGVGKSTVAANLALSFARQGLRAGILDTDLFGPSIPTLFNLVNQEPRLTADNRLIPLSNYGVKTMSIGNLIPSDSPVIWRGLMVMKALHQLLHGVEWGSLDVLVLDLPPGTGDTQLSISQEVILDGAVVITTPHTLALADATKGIAMFQKLQIPLLGLIQNMSVFTCPCCNTSTRVFGPSTGVTKLCADHSIPLLGDIPLHPAVGHDADRGKPTVVAEPESERAAAFMEIAEKVATRVSASQ